MTFVCKSHLMIPIFNDTLATLSTMISSDPFDSVYVNLFQFSLQAQGIGMCVHIITLVIPKQRIALSDDFPANLVTTLSSTASTWYNIFFTSGVLEYQLAVLDCSSELILCCNGKTWWKLNPTYFFQNSDATSADFTINCDLSCVYVAVRFCKFVFGERIATFVFLFASASRVKVSFKAKHQKVGEVLSYHGEFVLECAVS